MNYETRDLTAAPVTLAPDGSEIREGPRLKGGSFAHCTLPAGQVSRPVAHRTVEEIWYCVAGAGEVWRRQGEHAEVITFLPGVSLTIPLGTSFQFRATDSQPLEFVIVTMPAWPGAGEAYEVTGRWE